MARSARLVLPGLPHHVTQRGTRRQPTFYDHADYQGYLGLLRDKAREHGVAIGVYCLMPNHVHHSATPREERSLRKAFGQCHWRHAWRVNQRHGWRGHLWQERFYSCPMGAAHALLVARYILFNPVRAGLVARPEDWPYSSARFHLGLTDGDPLVSAASDLTPREWTELLSEGPVAAEQRQELRENTRSGLPLGDEGFVAAIEKRVRRRLRPRRPGSPVRPNAMVESAEDVGQKDPASPAD